MVQDFGNLRNFLGGAVSLGHKTIGGDKTPQGHRDNERQPNASKIRKDSPIMKS
jgi:hypothetical protein